MLRRNMLGLGRAVPLRLTVLLIAGGILVLTVGTGKSVPTVTRFGFDDSAGQSSFALQAKLGTPIRRIAVGWDQVEPAPSVWHWTAIDQAYRDLLSVGLRPLFVATASPCWAHPSSPCMGSRGGAIPPDPAYYAAWAEFVRQLAERYPAAAAIEVWNEENLQPEFLPYPDPARYTELLRLAYGAVRHVSRRIPVISGGLYASSQSGPYGIGDARFLAGMYAAGAKGLMNGISIHIYPGAAASESHAAMAAVKLVLEQLRRVRAGAHDSSTPLWVTELGISTQAGPLASAPVSEAQQAADLVAIVQQLGRARDIGAVIIHRLIDLPPALATFPGYDSGYGVFRADGSPKVAACRLSVVFHGSLHC